MGDEIECGGVVCGRSGVAPVAPLPIEPSMLKRQLRSARERTYAYLEDSKERDFRAQGWRHSFVGMLNVYEWFAMIAAHQVRHAMQMREIGEGLPKLVTSTTNW